jgi:hypothetical protein
MTKILGMFFFCDGWGSLIAYMDSNERFVKNHLVRIVRMIFGLYLIIWG